MFCTRFWICFSYFTKFVKMQPTKSCPWENVHNLYVSLQHTTQKSKGKKSLGVHMCNHVHTPWLLALERNIWYFITKKVMELLGHYLEPLTCDLILTCCPQLSVRAVTYRGKVSAYQKREALCDTAHVHEITANLCCQLLCSFCVTSTVLSRVCSSVRLLSYLKGEQNKLLLYVTLHFYIARTLVH